jgi:ribosome maturation factor RimP
MYNIITQGVALPLLRVCIRRTHSLKSEALKQLCQPIFSKHHVKCYSMTWKTMGKDRILEVLVYDPHRALDLDTTALVSFDVSEALDEVINQLPDEYMLDVSTAGIEREILDDEQLHDAIDHSVYIRTLRSVNKSIEFKGIMTQLDEKTITLVQKIKGKVQTLSIDRENIVFIRHAIKD